MQAVSPMSDSPNFDTKIKPQSHALRKGRINSNGSVFEWSGMLGEKKALILKIKKIDWRFIYIVIE